jgi:anhydro-N-acetylmuramic acid kinase
MRAIGLMSGTSMDGIDVALVETDGVSIARFGPSAVHAYDDGQRELLRRAAAAAAALHDRAARPEPLAQAENVLTRLHAAAVEDFLSTNGIVRETIDVVGFHGQTVLHRPHAGLTVQLGDGPALARASGIPVVFDFRAADVAAGGEGAPLVPAYHRALVAELDRPAPVVVLNLGGVANITYIDGDADPIACDTGPGNALIDDLMRVRTGAPCDRDGATAARGLVDEAFVARALRQPFFDRPPPKSLDRNDFAGLDLSGFSAEDGAATLTALTAASVAQVVPLLPRPPRSFIVAGGGAQNPTMMHMLAARLAPATVESADAVGWSADSLEAQAFAFLAVRSLRGLPLTFPSTTGVMRPVTGGALARP